MPFAVTKIIDKYGIDRFLVGPPPTATLEKGKITIKGTVANLGDSACAFIANLNPGPIPVIGVTIPVLTNGSAAVMTGVDFEIVFDPYDTVGDGQVLIVSANPPSLDSYPPITLNVREFFHPRSMLNDELENFIGGLNLPKIIIYYPPDCIPREFFSVRLVSRTQNFPIAVQVFNKDVPTAPAVLAIQTYQSPSFLGFTEAAYNATIPAGWTNLIVRARCIFAPATVVDKEVTLT